MLTKYLERCPRSRKVAGVVALSDPATYPQIPSCSFLGFLQWIQHIFTLITNQTRTHSYCQAASPCRHRIYGSQAQSLRFVRFGLRLAERAGRVGFGTTAEYSAKLQDVLKLSSNKSRCRRCPPEQKNKVKTVLWPGQEFGRILN
jgi:hypothetical protein